MASDEEGYGRMTVLYESNEKEFEEATLRLHELAARHAEAFDGREFCAHPNPYMEATHAFCDFVESSIADGVPVTKDVLQKEFDLSDAAWEW